VFGRQQDSELLCAAMTWVVEGVRGADQTTTDLAVFLWVENVEAVILRQLETSLTASAEALAERLQVSPRTITNAINTLNRMLAITSLCSTLLVGMKLTPHLRPGLAALCVLLSDFWKGSGANGPRNVDPQATGDIADSLRRSAGRTPAGQPPHHHQRHQHQTTTDLAVFLWVENVEAVTAAGGAYGRRRGQHPSTTRVIAAHRSSESCCLPNTR
jgi:hypothetical protein